MTQALREALLRRMDAWLEGKSSESTAIIKDARAALSQELPQKWKRGGTTSVSGYYWVQWGGPGHSIGVVTLRAGAVFEPNDCWLGPLVAPPQAEVKVAAQDSAPVPRETQASGSAAAPSGELPPMIHIEETMDGDWLPTGDELPPLPDADEPFDREDWQRKYCEYWRLRALKAEGALHQGSEG